jgi:hypothetical protein
MSRPCRGGTPECRPSVRIAQDQEQRIFHLKFFICHREESDLLVGEPLQNVMLTLIRNFE